MGYQPRVVLLTVALLLVPIGCSRSSEDDAAPTTTRPGSAATAVPADGGTTTTIDLQSATFCQLMGELRIRVEGIPEIFAPDRATLVPKLYELYQRSGPLFDALVAKAPPEIAPQTAIAMGTLATADEQTLLTIENDPQSLPDYAAAAVTVRDWTVQNCPGTPAPQ